MKVPSRQRKLAEGGGARSSGDDGGKPEPMLTATVQASASLCQPPGDSLTQVTRADIARLMGVRRQAVSNWIVRRPRNGFPHPVGTAMAQLRRGERRVQTWDLAEILAWRASYVPRTRRRADDQQAP